MTGTVVFSLVELVFAELSVDVAGTVVFSLVELVFAVLLLLELVVSVFTVLLEVLVAAISADTGRLVTSIPDPSANIDAQITSHPL